MSPPRSSTASDPTRSWPYCAIWPTAAAPSSWRHTTSGRPRTRTGAFGSSTDGSSGERRRLLIATTALDTRHCSLIVSSLSLLGGLGRPKCGISAHGGPDDGAGLRFSGPSSCWSHSCSWQSSDRRRHPPVPRGMGLERRRDRKDRSPDRLRRKARNLRSSSSTMSLFSGRSRPWPRTATAFCGSAETTGW